MTKLLGVIGDPIAHSMSPLIHNGWLRDLSIDALAAASSSRRADRRAGVIWLTMRYSTILFDLDNTLYPRHTDLFSQIDQKMTTYRLSVNGIDQVNKLMGMFHMKRNHVIFTAVLAKFLQKED